MQRPVNFLPVFLSCLILTIIVFFFSQSGFGRLLTGFFEQVTVPLQRFTFQTLQGKNALPSEAELQKENKKLLLQLAKQKDLEKENKALHDQFETEDPSPKKLLPAQVIGIKEEEMIIDKGSSDSIKVGMIIVVKDNVIGRIIKTSTHLSVVELITHKNTSFTAETSKTSTLGVIKGKGANEIFLENVVLSDKLEKNDIVKTKGDVDKNGIGYPPGLVVGKITAVYKKTSALFQTAEIQTLVDFFRLQTVFVMKDF